MHVNDAEFIHKEPFGGEHAVNPHQQTACHNGRNDRYEDIR